MSYPLNDGSRCMNDSKFFIFFILINNPLNPPYIKGELMDGLSSHFYLKQKNEEVPSSWSKRGKEGVIYVAKM
jgi:hypothetical protein